MKTIFILLSVFALSSCDDFAKAKYEVAIPTKDGIYEYYLHTDSISYENGCISFIPLENEYEGEVLVSCGKYEVTKLK